MSRIYEALQKAEGQAHPAETADRLRREAEDVVRYYGDLNQRVASAGVGGVSGLLDLAGQLSRALSGVSTEELDRVGREIKGLVEQLVQIDSQIRTLRELKIAIAGAPGAHQTGEPRDV